MAYATVWYSKSCILNSQMQHQIWLKIDNYACCVKNFSPIWCYVCELCIFTLLNCCINHYVGISHVDIQLFHSAVISPNKWICQKYFHHTHLYRNKGFYRCNKNPKFFLFWGEKMGWRGCGWWYGPFRAKNFKV